MPPPVGVYPNNRQGSCGGPQQMVGYLNRNFVYGTHIEVDSTASAYKYNRTTGAIQTIDLTTVVSNRLELPLWRPTDDHYGLITGVDSADIVHIMGNSHDAVDPVSANMHHIACTDVANFTNPASWAAGSEPGAALDSSPDGGTYTYHYCDRLTNGDLLWFHSQSPLRGNSRGRCILAYKRTGSGPFLPLLSSGGKFAVSAADAPQGLTADRVYVSGIKVDPVYNDSGVFQYDILWYYGIWRTMDEDAEFQQQPFLLYALSTDFDTWFNAAGTPVAAMPYAWGTRGTGLIPFPTQFAGNIRFGPWVSSGPAPKPVAVGIRNGNLTHGDQVAHRLYFDGTSWSEAVDMLTGMNPIEVTLHKNMHGYISQSASRLFYRGFTGSPTFNVGGNASTGAVAGGGNFIPRCCPVLLREENLWLANIGDGDTPRIFTIGGDWPAKV